MRCCQSIAAANSRERWASQMLIAAYGAALENASKPPTQPTASDGASVGAEPVNTWKPGFTVSITWMIFSMLPELSFSAMMFGCSDKQATASAEMSTPVACGQL